MVAPFEEKDLFAVIESIERVPEEYMDAARKRLDSLTKPPGSLGILEDLAARVAAIQGTARPRLEKKRVVVMAGDHGVVAQGVSPYPQEVTAQMVANFAAGGAAVNQLARWADAEVVVVNIGVAGDLEAVPGIVDVPVARGTADMTEGPAMARETALRALGTGVGVARQAAEDGVSVVAIGEMGIGNTTAASAITCALTGEQPAKVVGPGTGLDRDGVIHKVRVVERALAANRPDPVDALGILASLGGLEIAGLVGVVLGSAAAGIPVVADGFISGSAALSAVRLAPRTGEYLFPSHLSAEPGHRVVLNALDLRPVLDLDMRLGEGTGAVLAIGVMDAACSVMSGMATFGEAGVSEKSSA